MHAKPRPSPTAAPHPPPPGGLLRPQVVVMGGGQFTPEEIAAAEARFEEQYGLKLMQGLQGGQRTGAAAAAPGAGAAGAGGATGLDGAPADGPAPVHVLPLYAMLPQSRQVGGWGWGGAQRVGLRQPSSPAAAALAPRHPPPTPRSRPASCWADDLPPLNLFPHPTPLHAGPPP